jgi:hypothetical protein
VARGLIARAVPGIATGIEITEKNSLFHSLPRVSIAFNLNNKNINTPLRKTELAKLRPIWPLRAPRPLWGQRLMAEPVSLPVTHGV